MLPFSKDRLNHNDTVIIQLVSGSGEAQDLKLVNYDYCHSNQTAWVHCSFSLMIPWAVMLQ